MTSLEKRIIELYRMLGQDDRKLVFELVKSLDMNTDPIEAIKNYNRALIDAGYDSICVQGLLDKMQRAN